VEFAFMATILTTIVLGIFEIGSAWSDHQTITQASRSGARVASQLGTRPEADNEALRAVEAGFASVNGQISRIVIYEADANGDMPIGCQTAAAGYSGPENCNVYDAASIADLNTTSLWGSGGSCGTADGNWCSVTDRDDIQQSATYLGVQVEYERQYLTGFFGGGSHTVTEATVMRIEPGT
jgi:hypothetical protein